MNATALYWLAQLPGWGLSALVLYGLWRLVGVPMEVAVGLFGLVLLKDAVLFPFMRRALVAPARSGPQALVGASAVVVDPLAPEGRVRVGAELWRAAVRPVETRVEPGARVRVDRVDGHWLIVGAVDEGSG